MLQQRDASKFLSEEYFSLWDDYGVAPLFPQEQLTQALRHSLEAAPSPVTLTVEGNAESALLFVCEIQAEEADALLTRMIEAMKWQRQTVYLIFFSASVTPSALKSALENYLPTLRPKTIVAMGDNAVSALLPGTTSVKDCRGKFRVAPFLPNAPIMATYAPSLLLQNPEAKKLVWEDLKLVVAYLNES